VVLIIDDSIEDGDAVRRYLAQAPLASYTVYQAFMAAEGLQQCRALRPNVLLLDYSLPDASGLSVLRELTVETGRYGCAIIMLAGRGSEAIAVQAMQLGAHDYLVKKPQMAEQLYRAIESALAKVELQRQIEQQRRAAQTELQRRKLAEAELQAKQAQLRLAYDAAKLGTWSYDRVADIFELDEHAREHFGVAAERATMLELLHMVHPDDRKQVLRDMTAVLDMSHAGDYGSEFRVCRADGQERWLVARARVSAPTEHAGPVLSVGTVLDITAHRHAEFEARELNRVLEQRVAERTGELRSALERTQALYAITTAAIASDDLAEALRNAVDFAATALHADRILLLIFDWHVQRIEHFIYGGRGAERIYTAIEFDEFISGLSGWAVRERRSAVSPKGVRDPRESARSQQRRVETNCGSVVVSPLYHMEEVFGTLT
ncbi:MAG TPA: response regulator, partial [Roseiflexaceae bacterium]|nr:response regulator [Roseiflexaceae bacterium]